MFLNFLLDDTMKEKSGVDVRHGRGRHQIYTRKGADRMTSKDGAGIGWVCGTLHIDQTNCSSE